MAVQAVARDTRMLGLVRSSSIDMERLTEVRQDRERRIAAAREARQKGAAAGAAVGGSGRLCASISTSCHSFSWGDVSERHCCVIRH